MSTSTRRVCAPRPRKGGRKSPAFPSNIRTLVCGVRLSSGRLFMDRLIPVRGLWVLAILTSGCHARTRRDARPQNPLFTPAAGSPFNVGGRPNDMAVADLSKDGRLDVVTCNVEETVTVLLADGRGGFTHAPGSPFKAAAHLVAVGDVNNDGTPDLALTHHDSFGVEVRSEERRVGKE